ncbi:MAG: hypothetical protein M1826_002337 [Phylliscum demangeonii]|nr:MAG: hypothetical protein M1826_002337 [Phylliscum demangeonii]
MTNSSNTFRQGTSTFRNLRVRASEKPTQAITAANARAAIMSTMPLPLPRPLTPWFSPDGTELDAEPAAPKKRRGSRVKVQGLRGDCLIATDKNRSFQPSRWSRESTATQLDVDPEVSMPRILLGRAVYAAANMAGFVPARWT